MPQQLKLRDAYPAGHAQLRRLVGATSTDKRTRYDAARALVRMQDAHHGLSLASSRSLDHFDRYLLEQSAKAKVRWSDRLGLAAVHAARRAEADDLGSGLSSDGGGSLSAAVSRRRRETLTDQLMSRLAQRPSVSALHDPNDDDDAVRARHSALLAAQRTASGLRSKCQAAVLEAPHPNRPPSTRVALRWQAQP